jgi:DNA-binding CsgD family transcriptional regulator
LSHRGTVHGVAEFVSTRAGRFEGAERRAIEAVSEAAGLRLGELSESGSNGATVVFDVECRDPATLFPDLPRGGSIVVDHVSVTGADTLFLDGRVEGYVEATVRDYVAGTPGLELDSIRRTGEGPYDVSVRVGGGGDRIGAVADVLSWTDVRLTGVRGRAGADVLEFRTTDPTRVAAVRERLAEAVGSCSLISKRHVDDTRARADRVGADLTDRQREVLETAVREGYYDDPRGVSGTELAERFDVSSSTLHQHLRAAESKVLREFLAR